MGSQEKMWWEGSELLNLQETSGVEKATQEPRVPKTDQGHICPLPPLHPWISQLGHSHPPPTSLLWVLFLPGVMQKMCQPACWPDCERDQYLPRDRKQTQRLGSSTESGLEQPYYPQEKFGTIVKCKNNMGFYFKSDSCHKATKNCRKNLAQLLPYLGECNQKPFLEEDNWLRLSQRTTTEQLLFRIFNVTLPQQLGSKQAQDTVLERA